MRKINTTLAACGLAIIASPLCFQVQAQEYIDVEAERRAGSAPIGTTSAPVDPYGARAAQEYPTTSYGINSAPAAGPAVNVAPSGYPQGGSDSGQQNMGQLLYQVQQLQQEVMRLNGMVEEQAYEIRTLKEQSLERYVDLDRRLGSLAGGDAASAAVAGIGAADAGANARPTATTTAPRTSSGAVQPGEADAYRAAYALVRSQQFEQAVTAFRQFLQSYPSGKYAANAHYWLGELYLVVQPADLESARQSFSLLIDQYPDNPKVPDALYKLGKVQYLKGNREKAREYLEQVIRDYGSSNNSAVQLAQDFINENY